LNSWIPLHATASMRLATSPRPPRRTVSNLPFASGFGSNANTGTSIFGGGANNTGSTMFGGGNNASSSSPFGGSGMWNGCASLSRRDSDHYVVT
jgi:nuclear pore complex protein Nup98-Nup96